MGKRNKLAVSAMTLGLTLLMVACGSGNTDEAVVEVNNKQAEVTTEELDEGVVQQTEVYEETDDVTGEITEVHVVKTLENGQVVGESEMRYESGTEEVVEGTVVEPLEEGDEVVDPVEDTEVE